MAGSTIDTWDPAPVVSRLLAIDDSAGPNNVTVTPGDLAGQMLAEGPIKDRVDQIEATAATGDKKLAPVRLLLTSATAPSAMTAGSTHDGLVVAAGDDIARAVPGGSVVDGIYRVQASGAALRRDDADTGAELVRASFTVDAGTNAGTTWFVETDAITIGTTPISIKKVANAPAIAGEVVAARGGKASLSERLASIEGGGSSKLDAAVYAARFYTRADIPGWKNFMRVVRDTKGRARVFYGIRSDGTVFDRQVKEYATARRYTLATDVSGWSQINTVCRDRRGRLRLVEGLRLENGIERKVDTRLSGLRTTGGGGVTPQPTVDYLAPARANRSFVNPPNRISGGSSSLWSFVAEQIGPLGVITSITSDGYSYMGNQSKQLVSTFSLDNMIATSVDVGFWYEHDDHSTSVVVLDARLSPPFIGGWPARAPQDAAVPLQLIQIPHGGSHFALKRGQSLDPMSLGEPARILPDKTALSYIQPWRQRNAPDIVDVFARRGPTAPPRQWMLARSTDNLATGFSMARDVWGANANLYMLSSANEPNNEYACFFHNHPADTSGTNPYTLKMAFMTYAGAQWSYANGGRATPFVSNVFALERDALPDVFVSGYFDTIFDPRVSVPPDVGVTAPSATACCRMTDAKAVGVDHWQVAAMWFDARPGAADTSKSRFVLIDIKAVDGALVISHTWAGAVGGFHTGGNGYAGCASILRESVIARCRMPNDRYTAGIAAGAGVMDIVNLTTGSPVNVSFEYGLNPATGKPFSVTNLTVSAHDLYRPIGAREHVWDGTTYRYELGDFFVLNDASKYNYYDDYKADHVFIKVPGV